jgi:hypothetical protein
MSGDESIIEVRRGDSGASSLSRDMATPQSIILEERNLNKIQPHWSNAIVTFFQEAQYIARFFVENMSMLLHVEQRHD